MPEKTINNIRVHYVCSGKGAEPVVLVHGFTTSHAMWYRQIPALAAAGYRAVAYDVRGHGDTERAGEGCDMDTLVADLLALLDSLDIERAHIAGLSMGGIIGQRFCLDHPERAIPLTASDTFPGRPDQDTLLIFDEHVEIVRREGLSGLFDHILEHPALPVAPDFQVPLEAMEAYRKDFMKNDAYSLARFVEMFRSLPDWTAELGSLKMHALLIAGSLDWPCMAPMQRMHGAITDSEFRIIEGAGHSSAIEKADQWNGLFLGFLDKHSAGA